MVKYNFEYASVALNAAGAAVSDKHGVSFGNQVSMAMPKRQFVVESIMNHNPINFLHKYDAEGKFTEVDWQ